MPTKIKVKGDDPKKPTAAQLEAANKFAQQFTAKQGLGIASMAHVGNQIPAFVNSAGQDITGVPAKLPSNLVSDIRQIPSYVTPDNIILGKDGLHYFEDQSTGDMKPIHPDILRSPRFNPNRGKTADMMLVSR